MACYSRAAACAGRVVSARGVALTTALVMGLAVGGSPAHADPFSGMSPGDRSLVEGVIDGATLRHRMPTREVECEPEMFALLIERPELVVEVWNLMGISGLRLDPTGPATYRAIDVTGTAGDVRVVHTSRSPTGERLVVAHCVGSYEAKPMPKSLTAESVLVFRWRPLGPAGERSRIRADLDAYVDVDRPAAQLLAKALRPLVTRTAEHNFTETLRFISLFSRTAERNPAGMLRLANHLQKIDTPTRERFVAVCRHAADRSAQRLEARRRVAAIDDGVAPAAAFN